jgi:hypothetical protein
MMMEPLALVQLVPLIAYIEECNLTKAFGQTGKVTTVSPFLPKTPFVSFAQSTVARAG